MVGDIRSPQMKNQLVFTKVCIDNETHVSVACESPLVPLGGYLLPDGILAGEKIRPIHLILYQDRGCLRLETGKGMGHDEEKEQG